MLVTRLTHGSNGLFNSLSWLVRRKRLSKLDNLSFAGVLSNAQARRQMLESYVRLVSEIAVGCASVGLCNQLHGWTV